MIEVKHGDQTFIFDKYDFGDEKVILSAASEDDFQKAKMSFSEDKGVQNISATDHLRLLKWINQIEFSGTLTEFSIPLDKNGNKIITNKINFVNGLISDLPNEKYTCFQKFYSNSKFNVNVRIVDGLLPKTPDVIWSGVFGNGIEYSYFGFKEINIHGELLVSKNRRWISDFEFWIMSMIKERRQSFKGIVGEYRSNGIRGPMFGGDSTKLSLWYENSGLTMEELWSMKDDDWELIYQESNLFHKGY